MTTRRTKGQWGESQAVSFLLRQGFQVVERNFYTTVGEIDIIATKGGDYYCVEVKTRLAGPWANDTAVTASKKHKMAKTAREYLRQRGIVEKSLILASCMVVVTPATRQVALRLAVIL